MKATSALGIAIVALSLAFAAQAECTFPKPPADIPDGKSASEPEMIEAMRAFKAYQEEVTAFTTCVDQETENKAAGSAQLMQLKTLRVKKHNAALSQLQAKAKQFNEQVRIFKSRG